MYKLLIVDDEEYITDGLCEAFKSRKDIKLDIYKAYSATEALGLLKKIKIDIVLSDIHMPGMDGLELLKEIKNKYSECRVIFLTGYNEFDYVYSAIQYQGAGYLLKSESFDTITNVVEDELTDIDQRMKEKEILKKAEEQLKVSAELMKKEYFTGIVRGFYDNEEIIRKELKNLEINLDAGRPVLLLLARCDEIPEKKSYTRRVQLLCLIKLITEKYFPQGIVYTNFFEDNITPVWLIQPVASDITDRPDEAFRKTIRSLTEAVESAQPACEKIVNTTVSFVLDDDSVGWNKIPERFQTLKMLLNYRIGSGKGMLITNKLIVEKETGRGYEEDENFEISRYTTDILLSNLDNWQTEYLNETLGKLTNKLANVSYKDYLPAHGLYYSIALAFLSFIHKWKLKDRVEKRIDLNRLMNAYIHDSWNYAADYLKELWEIIMEIQESDQDTRAQSIIKKIQKHIEDNLDDADELTLARLADLVYFNQSYLSRLFKQVTGFNFSEYISEARMRKSKELLRRHDMRIREIAESVGFSSATNFARFFKKYSGVTPQEYRDSLAFDKN